MDASVLQDHLARALLGWDLEEAHDAVGDAIKSMRLWALFAELKEDPGQLRAAQEMLLATAQAPSFAKRHPTYEGVCMGNRKTCTCGAPFFSVS